MNSADRLAKLVADTVGVELPVRIRLWDGSEAGPVDGPVLVIRSRQALRRIAWAPGELGLARAYVTGGIDVDTDLDQGFRRAWSAARTAKVKPRLTRRSRIAAVLSAARLGALGLPPRPPRSEALLSGPLHSRRRDRAAIAHHYDLSNQWYELLLDEHMAYSSGYFAGHDESLYEGQTAKLDRICRQLELTPGQRLLDVGCGWGSMILYAAREYGVKATGLTLSAEQCSFVMKRAQQQGLSDLVEVRLQDYRDLDAHSQFDAVSSIEMGEHVGEAQYPSYVDIMYRSLKPGGALLLQQMSRRADAAPGGGPFIERYIAPDMHMRPLWQTLKYLQDSGFEVRDVLGMREHYVRTVRHWMANFDENYETFVALQGEEVARVWRLYLVGGALAFEENRMGVDQIRATKPS